MIRDGSAAMIGKTGAAIIGKTDATMIGKTDAKIGGSGARRGAETIGTVIQTGVDLSSYAKLR
jgi:hypothetical protein